MRTDAGTLFAMGTLFAGAGGNRHRFVNPHRGCTPTNNQSNLGLYPARATMTLAIAKQA